MSVRVHPTRGRTPGRTEPPASPPTGPSTPPPQAPARGPELVRPADAFFLHAETPLAPQHVGGLAILDPSGRDGGPLRLEEVTACVLDRLRDHRRLRQRLLEPVPGLARLVWVEDEAFDIEDHVHHVVLHGDALHGDARHGDALHGDADERRQHQLTEFLDTVMAEPCDRSRPLWDMYLISGLAGGRQALLLKLHHAIADGLGALDVATHLLEPEPTTAPVAPRRWDTEVPDLGLGFRTACLLSQTAAPLREVRGVAARIRTRPRRWLQDGARVVAGVWELARLGEAPASPLNGPLARSRRTQLTEVPVASIEEARQRARCTSHDVLLIAVAEAVSRYLRREVGDEAPEILRTMIPVAGRNRLAGIAPGSWTSTLSVDIPVGPMSLDARVAAVRSEMRRARRSRQPLGARFVMEMIGTWAPPPLHARFARFAYCDRWFNLIVSSLRGVTSARYLCSAPVVAAYPLLPLASDVRLVVGTMTWMDALTIGLTADEVVGPALEMLARDIEDTIEQLRKPG